MRVSFFPPREGGGGGKRPLGRKDGKENAKKTHRLGHVVGLVPEDRDPRHGHAVVGRLVDRVDPPVRHERREPPVAQQVVLRDPGQRPDVFRQIQVGDGHGPGEVRVRELPEGARRGQEGQALGEGPVLVGGDGDEGSHRGVDDVVGFVLLFFTFFFWKIERSR